jgi:TnpA family transposase
MRNIHRWQHQYIGTSEVPKSLSVVELQEFFTFSPIELEALQSKRKDALKLAAAIQLGFLKMTGCPLPDLGAIPLRLLRHVASELGVPPVAIATLRSLYERGKTRYEHQWWAMELLGFSKIDAAGLKALAAYLNQEASTAPTTDALTDRARAWLYQHSLLAMPTRELRALAVQAMASAETSLLRMIHEQVRPADINEWVNQVLATHPETGRTTLEWLQQPPRRKSVNAIRERTARIDFLKKLGVHQVDVNAIYFEKIKAYAAELRNMRPVKFRELKEPTRTLRLISFLRWTLLASTDAAIMLGARRVTKLISDAYKQAESLEAKAAKPHHQALVEIFARVNDESVSDEQFRGFVRELSEQYTPPKFASRAAAARWLLSEPNPEVRTLLSELRKLDLQGEPDAEVVKMAQYLHTLYVAKQGALPEQPPVRVPRTWRELIEGEDRERAMRALEACTLIGLRKGLRSGAVYVAHSDSFRGRAQLLISDEDWTRDRVVRYQQLSLPADGTEFLEVLTRDLELKLRELGAAVEAGKLQTEDGRFHVTRFKPVVESQEVAQNRNDLINKIGVVQFPDLILEMDSRTGFSKILLGRVARDVDELLAVYAGMIAHGCALDASQVSHSIPQLAASAVLRGMTLFENTAALRAANDAVVSFQKRLPICAAWGDGSLASADMMSLDVSKHIWLARADYRRKLQSIGTYTLVSDFWSVLYDTPIILNERQAGAAIEAALRQTEADIGRLAVDTHGYTDFAMGLAKLLGFALCPRLARFAERKLYVPSNMKDIPESLADLTIRNISLPQIKAAWDDLVRIAASVETGHVSATVLMARYGSAASDNPIYKAGVHLGRLMRSLYLCDFLLSEDLRRAVNRILVHGESVHQLQRAIYTGTYSKPRGQHVPELHAASGALTLMTNLCLAWTANKMQDTLLGEHGQTLSEDELRWLAQVSPARFSNINFRGVFTFPVEQYARWLFSGNASRAA